jgi:guanosine-3',5'-bis(diphosphate) 3'-pyrophosphohydrolase
MEDSDSTLEKVKDFTNTAHGNQTRRYSHDPYIVHPMRVMTLCRNYTPELAVLSAAILHDVLEDTSVTKEQLESFLHTVMEEKAARKTIRLVVDLTDVYTRQNYPRMNRRVRREKEAERLSTVDPDAQTIKYADILDNTDVTTNDPDFAWTFLHECRNILEKMDRGNPELRSKAMKRVNDCLEYLKTGESIPGDR